MQGILKTVDRWILYTQNIRISIKHSSTVAYLSKNLVESADGCEENDCVDWDTDQSVNFVINEKLLEGTQTIIEIWNPCVPLRLRPANVVYFPINPTKLVVSGHGEGVFDDSGRFQTRFQDIIWSRSMSSFHIVGLTCQEWYLPSVGMYILAVIRSISLR